MASLAANCWDGTVTELQIDQASKAQLDEPGGPKNLTPLSCACYKGRIDVVRWLMKAGADVNKGDAQGCTPLWYATAHCPSQSRLSVVQDLLTDSTVNIDAAPNDRMRNTPLMNAIKVARDVEVTRFLVDKGADITALINAQGMTAKDLAGSTEFAAALEGGQRLLSSIQDTSSRAVDLVATALGWVNKRVIKDDVGVVKKYFNFSPDSSIPSTDPKEQAALENIQKEIGNPANIVEMTQRLDTYVRDSGLEKFFRPGDPFISAIAEKAFRLSQDPHDTLNTPKGIRLLTSLALYQTVIYCDDSGSMGSDGPPTRYEMQCDLVGRIARIATKLAPDGCGVQLCFINGGPSTMYTSDNIMAAMKANSPGGGTPLGSSLYNNILQPLVYKQLDNGRLERPILICTITDGSPNSSDNPTFKGAIVECKKKLDAAGYDPFAVRYLISQIGEDSYAARFLKELDDDHQIKDVLYCTSRSGNLGSEFKKLQSNEREMDRWLLETLTAPLVSSE